ncbi:MAG: TIGR04053 family radical SAM/SPASM domain-containing protein [Deltaproteobacteria bacterium]|nr:TIGR04053 family radical SAM/SPASM domain-containing protein [Deltaproteobacteria bacterium]
MSATPTAASADTAVGGGRTDLGTLDFERAPFLVIWEVTRACDLACVHCRAEAVPARDPRELSTAEGCQLLEQVAEFGSPLLVLTGGDPIKRPDIYDLISYGDRAGLRMTMTPSGTPLMTHAVIDRLKAAGLARIAVSLDGASAAAHDAFRRVRGSFDWSLDLLGYARSLGLSTQVNTTVTRFNFDDFDALAELMTGLGIDLWSVFFLVPTGRGRPQDEISAEQYEAIFAKMFSLSQEVPFDIKSTAAPHYRRFLLQRRAGARRQRRPLPAVRGLGFAIKDGQSRAPKSVNDGNGFVFISHTGEVFPSGFLPISAGSVRQQRLAAIYRDSELFRTLRDYQQLKGKCGVCEFRDVCGGSRARAFSMTGDYLESDPFCAYVPGPYRKAVAAGTAEPVAAYFARRLAAHCQPDAAAP